MKTIISWFPLWSLILLACFLYETSWEENKAFPWKWNDQKSLSDLMDSVESTPLDSFPGTTPKHIDKLLYAKDRYYLFDYSDQNRIFAFNSLGKYLFSIGRAEGHNSEKQMSIRNFTTSEKNVFLLDDTDTTLTTYDRQGQRVGKRRLPFLASDLAVFANGQFLFTGYPDLVTNKEGKKYKVAITDSSFQIRQYFCPTTDLEYQNLSKMNHFSQTDSFIVFHSLFSDTVYFFNRAEGTLESTLTMNFSTSQSDFYLLETPIPIAGYLIGNLKNQSKVSTYAYDVSKKEAVPNPSGHDSYLFSPLCYRSNQIVACVQNLTTGYPQTRPISPQKNERNEFILRKYTLKDIKHTPDSNMIEGKNF